MNRSVLVAVLSVALTSCAADPIRPSVWSLSRTDADNNQVFLGGHLTLGACQRAGVEFFIETRDDSGVLQCQLNCRMSGPTDPVACEATEPVG